MRRVTKALLLVAVVVGVAMSVIASFVQACTATIVDCLPGVQCPQPPRECGPWQLDM